MRRDFFLVLGFITLCWLAGCGSTYYKPEPPSLDLALVRKPVYITDYTDKSTVALYSQCLSTPTQSTQGVINSLLCSQALLGRTDVSKAKRQFALKRNRDALKRLITLKIAKKEDKAHLHTSINLTVPIQFASLMRAKEPALQPEIIGEYGVAIVVKDAASLQAPKHYYPQEGVYRAYTLIFEGVKIVNGEAFVSLDAKPIDKRTTVRVGNNAYLARYSPGAAYLALLNDADIDALSWKGFVGLKLAEQRRGIYVIGELSHHKMPLIMVHGLNSDPLVWRYLTMAVLNDEWLNERYQIWHVLYPSGQPPFFNAMKIRRELHSLIDDIDNPLITREAVFIGHSMGGIITKLLSTQSNDDFWKTTFVAPPSIISQQHEKDIHDLFFFDPVFESSTVFYLDTPHKGSALATSALGYIGSSLVSIPDNLKHLFSDVLETLGLDIVQPDMQPFIKDAKFKSIDMLKPGHPLMTALYKKKIKGRAYSVIGSRKETECDTREVCLLLSDGVVTYDSADIPDALERLIVVSKHNSFKSPEAVAFILEHL